MYCSDLATAGGLVSPLFSAGSVHNINIDIMHEIRVRFSRKHEKRVIPCHTRYTAYQRQGPLSYFMAAFSFVQLMYCDRGILIFLVVNLGTTRQERETIRGGGVLLGQSSPPKCWDVWLEEMNSGTGKETIRNKKLRVSKHTSNDGRIKPTFFRRDPDVCARIVEEADLDKGSSLAARHARWKEIIRRRGARNGIV